MNTYIYILDSDIGVCYADSRCCFVKLFHDVWQYRVSFGACQNSCLTCFCKYLNLVEGGVSDLYFCRHWRDMVIHKQNIRGLRAINPSILLDNAVSGWYEPRHCYDPKMLRCWSQRVARDLQEREGRNPTEIGTLVVARVLFCSYVKNGSSREG